MASDKDDMMASNNASIGEKSIVQDEELHELLDSALEDFDTTKLVEERPNSAETKQKVNKSDEESLGSLWTEEFIKQATSQFEQNLQSILTSGNLDGARPDDVGETLQKIAQAAARVVSEDSEEGEFSSTIAQTLKNLSEGTTNLQSPMSDEDMMKMFANMGLGAEDNSFPTDGDFLPMLQTMMQSLLSKDVLLPALKDIVEKYPGWLEENKPKLQESEHQKFDQQYRLMCQVCEELEKEQESDSEDVKKGRFDKILDLMQKMQDCGQPPKELVGDLNSIVQFDEQGNPKLPGLSNQCSLM